MNDTKDPPQHTGLGLGHLSQELVEIVTELGCAEGIPTLQAIVDVAKSRVPAADSVSVTSLRRGRFTTTAATDDLSRRGDALQYSLRSGPCVDAVLDRAVYHPEDLAHDTRWPVFGRAASHDLGICSMLAFRLYTESSDSVEGLNFYARAAGAFSDTDLVRGLLLATQTALAITRTKADHLTRALEGSREIGAAVGILMASEKLPYDKAFGLLRVASQERNRAVRQVAEDVIRTGTLQIPHVG